MSCYPGKHKNLPSPNIALSSTKALLCRSSSPLRDNTAIMLVSPTSLALPTVKTLADCADWSKTVAPYLPQLYSFPSDLANAGTNSEALRHLYITSNPLVTATAFSIATFPISLLVSEINKNYSQVDRVWSILPTIYHAHYAVWAHMNGLECSRVDNVLAFSVVWSLRLTFNYWRKGGYQVGSEDYRWMIIKERIGSLGFVVLNLIFISTAQIVRFSHQLILHDQTHQHSGLPSSSSKQSPHPPTSSS